MDKRRMLLVAGLAAFVAMGSGCMADDVVYVDEQGNELAVDTEGRPVLEEQAPVAPPSMMAVEPAPVEIAPGVAAPAQPPQPPPAAPRPVAPPARAARSGAPAPDPSWDLGSTPRPAAPSPVAPSAPAQPERKVDTSSDLDRPPAG